MLIDSHAHLDFPDFAKDLDEVIDRAKKAGVEKIINIGADLELSQKAIEIASAHNNIWATVGVHAEYTENHDLGNLKEKLKELALSSDRVVAIGECGPDYNWSQQNAKKQLDLFEIQIELAKELDLPLIAHIRNANDEKAANDAYHLLLDSGHTKGVIHCFTLERGWVDRFTTLGFYLGFTGIITYKNADSVRACVEETPIERILIETDAPYLAPQSVRGKRNEPAYVKEIAEKIAEIKKMSYEEIASQTSKNAETLFRI